MILPMDKPIGFIFDLDGVLADTVELHYRAWKQIAAQINVPFTREDMNGFLGRRRRDCLLDLLGDQQIADADLQALLERKDQLYQAELDAVNPVDVVLPGVFEFVDAARAKEIRLGVASSSANARQLLEKTGLITRMRAVADGFTVKRSKPAPDIFIWVAGALQVRPAQAVVFEDSQAGVAAARTAGMVVVGIGDEARSANPDLTVSSIQSLNVDEILALPLESING